MQLYPNRAFWNPEIETLSRDELKELQFKKLKKQLEYNYKNSIFYKDQFDRGGIKPEDIQTFKDFTHIPTMDKNDERRCTEESLDRFGHPYGILGCAPLDKIVRLTSTSGTTGTPTLHTNTMNDVRVLRELQARKWWRLGLRPGDFVLHAMALSMFAAGFPIVDALQEYGVAVMPMGAEAGTERLLRHCELCKPTHMVCTPSFAEHIIKRCPEILGKPVSELRLKGLLCAGEPGAAVTEVRKRIMKEFNLKWLADFIGGSSAWHGYSCDSDQIEITRGMHIVSEDYCIFELLDAETKKSLELRDGVVGEICLTYLDWESTPLLRYRWGDVLKIFTSPCECGDNRLRFKIIGRVDDLLIIKGVNLYPAALKNFVVSFLPRVTGEFRILLDAPGPKVSPPLKIQVEYAEGVTEEDIPKLENEMHKKAHDILRVTPAIEFVPPNTFERTAYKSKYIVKLYKGEKP